MMDDYQRLKTQMQIQRENMQEKMNIYRENPTETQIYPSELQMPILKINGVPCSSQLQMNPSYINYATQQSMLLSSPSNVTSEMYIPVSPLKTEPSPQRTSSVPKLSPSIDVIHHLKIRAAQSQAIKRQQSINSIRKQKQKIDQLYENSMIVQNNIDNYPYGNIHSNVMEKIISKKRVQDQNNQEILFKFQREAEEFKKSKSKHIKNMLVQEKQRQLKKLQIDTDSLTNQLKEMESQMINWNEKKNNKSHNSEYLKERTSFDNAQTYDYEPLSNKKQSQIQYVPSAFLDSPKIIKTKKKPSYQRYPITNEGEDGLKFIRKNLHSLQISSPKLILDPIEPYQREFEQINDALKDIQSIMKNNRLYLNIKKKQNNIFSQKYNQHEQDETMPNNLKTIKKRINKMHSHDSSNLKQNREDLKSLSSVFD